MTRLYPIIFCLATLCAPVLSPGLHPVSSSPDNQRGEDLYREAWLLETTCDSLPPDSMRIVRLYQEAANLGFSPAQNYYGFILFNGYGRFLEADVDSALFWMGKAAENGDPKAANNIGWIYLKGIKRDKNVAEAIRWFELAADKGLPVAKAQLADIYRTGDGVEKDSLKAEELYIEAAEGGFSDAGMKLLAMMGEKYTSLPPADALRKAKRLYSGASPHAAIIILESLAERFPDAPETPEALLILGEAYSLGKGTAYDHEKSIKAYYEAAKKGNREARRIIAELLDIFPDAIPGAGKAADWYDNDK